MFHKAIFLVFALLAVSAYGQRSEDKLVIDNFQVSTSSINIITPDSSSFDPITRGASTNDPSILGVQRSLSVTAEEGSNQVLITSVSGGAWVVSTPPQGSGFAILQYDGQDNSLDLNKNGLGGVDLTENNAVSFRFVWQVDVDTSVNISVYSGEGQCSYNLNLLGDEGVEQEIVVAYSQFTQNCDFKSVGAIEFTVQMRNNVDLTLEIFSTYGLVVVTPSSTPVPSPSPTEPASRTSAPSNTPSVTPSVSHTRSISTSPSVGACTCNCPAFHCGLVYARPGDDDDTDDSDSDPEKGRFKGGHDDEDDDVIYRPVYYGPIDDDFDQVVGDPYGHPLIDRKGGLNHVAIKTNEDKKNSGSVLGASLFASVLIVVVAAF